jgi:hypothetical protein
MSDQFDSEQFTFNADKYTGNIRIWYRGVEIPRAGYRVRGSRQFFIIDNEFFIKAGYGAYASQCKVETHQYGKIEDCDRRYFPELLATCDFKDEFHWTAWRYLPLQDFYGAAEVFERCAETVVRLCRKYGIHDVIGSINWNWWIHNGEPLIVDIGCD